VKKEKRKNKNHFKNSLEHRQKRSKTQLYKNLIKESFRGFSGGLLEVDLLLRMHRKEWPIWQA